MRAATGVAGVYGACITGVIVGTAKGGQTLQAASKPIICGQQRDFAANSRHDCPLLWDVSKPTSLFYSRHTTNDHSTTCRRCRLVLHSVAAVANTMAAAIPHSQLAPLPTQVPFRLVSRTIGSGAYAWYMMLVRKIISPARRPLTNS